MSSSDISLLNKQRSLLLDKLQAFESSNKALRHILREHARRAVSSHQAPVLLQCDVNVAEI